jgi:hypothetical protein
VTARFLITNAGPGERSGVVVGHVVGPAGEVVKFRNGKAWGQWELTADGLRLEVGDSLLDLRGSPFRLVVDKGRARLDLRFAAAGVGPPPGIPSDVPGQGLELLTVATEVEASIQLRGMHQPIRTRGTGALIHGWAEREEFEGMVRRIDVLGMDENGPFYLVRTDHPDSPPRSWLVRVGGGDGLASVAEVGTLEDGRVGGAKPYPVPARLAIDAGGHVRGTVALEPPLLEYDPLEDFSHPWRWLISLSSKPRRYWSRCRVELVATETAGAAAEPSAADGVAIITYFNPLP